MKKTFHSDLALNAAPLGNSAVEKWTSTTKIGYIEKEALKLREGIFESHYVLPLALQPAML
ncbi:hypothetical protein [Sphingobacterium sp. LRF_L2]|uniref:hypothetical protein n=1 Tax=Sphingobacterium sp. LRF_L2 TaxID=3369421 RepID=UPI003F6404F1